MQVPHAETKQRRVEADIKARADQLAALVTNETQARTAKDLANLDVIATVLERLQQQALESFGAPAT
jgi:hypothetical protein